MLEEVAVIGAEAEEEDKIMSIVINPEHGLALSMAKDQITELHAAQR